MLATYTDFATEAASHLRENLHGIRHATGPAASLARIETAPTNAIDLQ